MALTTTYLAIRMPVYLLNGSQSYISKVLAKLTEDLGEPLFVRTSAGLEPTSYANNNYGNFGY